MIMIAIKRDREGRKEIERDKKKKNGGRRGLRDRECREVFKSSIAN